MAAWQHDSLAVWQLVTKGELIRCLRRNLFLGSKAQNVSKKELQEQKRCKLKRILKKGQEIVIDFTLPDVMTEKDCQILVKQTKLLYDNNMNAELPFSLNFAGLDRGTVLYETFVRSFHKFEEIVVNILNSPIGKSFPDKNVIYLTPDAPQALESLDARNVYILGGLVDYQVRKNITLEHAKKFNFEARRLPITEYMKRKDDKKYTYSKILSINQVFAILLKYYETRNWEEALVVGVPQRRGFVPISQYNQDSYANN